MTTGINFPTKEQMDAFFSKETPMPEFPGQRESRIHRAGSIPPTENRQGFMRRYMADMPTEKDDAK